jgi:hypothetical protein
MKIQIRKETGIERTFYHAYKMDEYDSFWRFIPNASVIADPNDEEQVLVELCREKAKKQLFPDTSIMVEYELDSDGEPISPTEGI